MEFKPMETLSEFVSSTQRILTVSKKPDTPQYMSMIRITAVGLAILGILGYVVELVSFLLRSTAV